MHGLGGRHTVVLCAFFMSLCSLPSTVHADATTAPVHQKRDFGSGVTSGANWLLSLWKAQPEARRTRSFTGIDVTEASLFVSSTTTLALNGNVDGQGFLLRAGGAEGRSIYRTGSVVGGEVETRESRTYGLLGYQWVGSDNRIAGFVGLDYQNNRTFPDDQGYARLGEETGLMVLVEADKRYKAFSLGVAGSYSAVFDSYWVRASLRYRYQWLAFGPDMLLAGAEDYTTLRAGFGLQGQISKRWSGFVSIGHGWTRDSDDNLSDQSFYSGLGLSYAR